MSITTKNVIAHLRWSTPSLWNGIHAYAREAKWFLMGSTISHEIPQHPRRFDGALLLVSKNVELDPRRMFPGAKLVDIRGGDSRFRPDGIVVADHERIGQLAADHLTEINVADYACLDFKRRTLGPRERSMAFYHRLLALHIAPARIHRWHCDGWREMSIDEAQKLKVRVKNWLHRVQMPIGIFAPDDYAAYVLTQVVLSLGYRIPGDVAILSSDNSEICQAAPIPISSVDSNLSRLGYEAARLLDKLMSGTAAQGTCIRIPPLGVEARRSTAAAKSNDPVVSSISLYIREHYMEELSAAKILRNIHASRTRAYIRFKRETGKTIGEEIQKIRLERAAELLETTDDKIDTIARLSGYRSTASFCQRFKKITGRTPGEQRKLARELARANAQ